MDREDNGMIPDWDDFEPDWLKDLLAEKGVDQEPAFEAEPVENGGPKHAAPEPEEPAAPKHMAPEPEAREPEETYEPRYAREPEETYEPRYAREPEETYEPRYTREPEAYAPERPKTEQGRIRPTEYVPYGVPEPEYEAEAAYAPKKKRRGGVSVPLIILIVLLVGGMLFAGWQLGGILLNYHRDRSAYNDLASSAVSAMAEKDEETTAAALPEDPMSSARVVSQVPISVDWDYLRSVNSDIVGWLYCPNTVINYPVVQTNDHDFYLDHGFDKAPNTSGTLFADKNSVAGIVQSNFIIYGHNMKDKSMFGSFQSYVNESYFVQNPTMYFLTPGGSYRVDLIGAHIVEGTVDNFPSYFENTEAYQAYLDSISSHFFWFNRAALNTDYQLLTMSTCTSAEGITEARLLVHGMMVPIQ